MSTLSQNPKTVRVRRWKERNPERWAENQRAYRERVRKPCRICGGKVPFPSPGAKYCGDRCRGIAKARANWEFYKKKREAWREWRLERGCSRCGYDKSAAALDLHHRDGGKSDRFTVKTFGTKWFYDEAKKCVVLCANCHRELHAGY